jgi:NADP-dependent 3-hydroxy acid dehydrogenase YdfG
MAGKLEGRRAIVTGASSGIGAATARAFASEGAAVALGARRADRLQDLAKEIESGGASAHALEVDITDEQATRAFVATAAEQMGGLDILVNNAGVMLLGAIEGADSEQWRRMVEVNVLGLMYATDAAMPLIREAGGGDIVNVASVAGRVAHAGGGAYNMTKFGVVGLSEALRQEALGSNIRVSLVEPGMVDTELQGHNEDPAAVEGIEKMRESIDNELLQSEDIADAILYVVSRPPYVAINEMLIRPAKQER